MRRLGKNQQEKIAHWDDERKIGNSLIITLKDGWCFGTSGHHVEGFDTKADARRAIRNTKECRCASCITATSTRTGKMTNYEYQDQIIAEIKRVQSVLEKRGYSHCDIHVMFDIKSSRLAGEARWDPNGVCVVRINLGMAKLNWPGFLSRTPGHEVCHIYAHQQWGCDGTGHGRGWKHTMQDAGFEPSRYHSYDTSAIPVKSKKATYAYSCGCQIYHLSAIRHNRIQRGIEYSCQKCGGTLTRHIEAK